MKTFKKYIKLRESSATDIGNSVVQNASLSGDQKESLSTLYKIADYMWNNYESAFKSWLNGYRGSDETLDRLMTQLGNHSSLRQAAKKTDFEDKEEIVPPISDTGGGSEEFE